MPDPRFSGAAVSSNGRATPSQLGRRASGDPCRPVPTVGLAGTSVPVTQASASAEQADTRAAKARVTGPRVRAARVLAPPMGCKAAKRRSDPSLCFFRLLKEPGPGPGLGVAAGRAAAQTQPSDCGGLVLSIATVAVSGVAPPPDGEPCVPGNAPPGSGA